MKDEIWLPAPKDIECVDVWPPGRLTQCARDAYDQLSREGRIVPVSVKRDAAGRVYVRYMSDIPIQWIREELREAKLRGVQMTIDGGQGTGVTNSFSLACGQKAPS